MPNTRPPAVEETPRFEIVRERDMGRRRDRPSPLLGGIVDAIRKVVEDAYVSLAQSVLDRTEQLEDARAARRHVRRTRAGERRRLRQERRRAEAGGSPPSQQALSGPRTVH